MVSSFPSMLISSLMLCFYFFYFFCGFSGIITLRECIMGVYIETMSIYDVFKSFAQYLDDAVGFHLLVQICSQLRLLFLLLLFHSILTLNCHLLRHLGIHFWQMLGWVLPLQNHYFYFYLFFKLGFPPCKAEQSLRGMELQEKHEKDYRIQKIYLERTCS